MSLACVYSRARIGLESPLVTVEVHLATITPRLLLLKVSEWVNGFKPLFLMGYELK
jgi:magnesium chelatase family protein